MNDHNDTQFTIEQLRIEHRDLDEIISILIKTGHEDEMRIQRLKKKKLSLRDRIVWLENMQKQHASAEHG